MHKRTDTIFAIDPGLRDLGYAFVSGAELILAGVLPLRGIPAEKKLAAVRSALLPMIDAYAPSVLVVETIPNLPLGRLAGLPALGRTLRRLAERTRLAHVSYSARAVRQSVVGDGWAGKRAVAETLLIRYPQLRAYLGHDRKWKDAFWHNMFDAIALGLHHQAATQPPSRGR